jgi:hypothetical protein
MLQISSHMFTTIRYIVELEWMSGQNPTPLYIRPCHLTAFDPACLINLIPNPINNIQSHPSSIRSNLMSIWTISHGSVAYSCCGKTTLANHPCKSTLQQQAPRTSLVHMSDLSLEKCISLAWGDTIWKIGLTNQTMDGMNRLIWTIKDEKMVFVLQKTHQVL